ncbi:Murein DD-endopeptidase MepM and murein hydrolase activator NlpD, contain LysM domain [Rhodovulum sp. ES.010]|uniref:M23 family metallopeptidase n=1 Tax=Rhodovulum sp. ES.010 TaxID=1882821 RepID=UPI0009278966|nr:M23 family metallopeptidase [Rhodovulum sp. ES.010]SIO05637.1 Murein DD-endopeptidase MepM and murein hydrolase activator NlpD, contain LysM domain [Rhodovulum sp. ES.010]
MASTHRPARALCLGLGVALLAGCESGWDYDFRNLGGEARSAPVRVETAPRPEPDARGVISYPTYQVAVARRGDSVGDVAARVGLPAAELARYNGIPQDARLRDGEVIALPRRVAAAAPSDGMIRSEGQIDIETLAGDAIERAAPRERASSAARSGTEPIRHKVARGETAYSIARLYNVTPRALADWNGLGADLSVREGQYLMIPVPAREATAAPAPRTPRPGDGSPAPTPPSATKPLPRQDAAPAPAEKPASPRMEREQTAQARFAMPARGSIIRGYQKGKNDGIDIAARAGSPVRAAADGTVAAITRDTDQVPILVVRHDDNLLSVYANIDGIAVEKGDRVRRGQSVAKVRAGSPAFLHFEIRNGFKSVDPMPYLTP